MYVQGMSYPLLDQFKGDSKSVTLFSHPFWLDYANICSSRSSNSAKFRAIYEKDVTFLLGAFFYDERDKSETYLTEAKENKVLGTGLTVQELFGEESQLSRKTHCEYQALFFPEIINTMCQRLAAIHCNLTSKFAFEIVSYDSDPLVVTVPTIKHSKNKFVVPDFSGNYVNMLNHYLSSLHCPVYLLPTVGSSGHIQNSAISKRKFPRDVHRNPLLKNTKNVERVTFLGGEMGACLAITAQFFRHAKSWFFPELATYCATSSVDNTQKDMAEVLCDINLDPNMSLLEKILAFRSIEDEKIRQIETNRFAAQRGLETKVTYANKIQSQQLFNFLQKKHRKNSKK